MTSEELRNKVMELLVGGHEMLSKQVFEVMRQYHEQDKDTPEDFYEYLKEISNFMEDAFGELDNLRSKGGRRLK